MPPKIDLQEVPPDHPDALPLLSAHIAHTSATSTPEACHALDLDDLKAADIRFFLAYADGQPLGTGALKTLPDGWMEVKSVHVAAAARGQGIARALMEALHDIAQQSSAVGLRLETGSKALPAFDPARGLYESLGYRYCAPFGDYQEHPQSTFMKFAFPAM